MEFKPGDELQVSCTFTTTSATEPVFYGLGTDSEMCLVFAAYYPYNPQMESMCQTSGGFGYCKGPFVSEDIVGYDDESCPSILYNMMAQSNYNVLAKVCDTHGRKCLPNCQQTIDKMYATEKCLRKEWNSYIFYILSRGVNHEFVNMLVSCQMNSEHSNDYDNDNYHGDESYADSHQTGSKINLLDLLDLELLHMN